MAILGKELSTCNHVAGAPLPANRDWVGRGVLAQPRGRPEPADAAPPQLKHCLSPARQMGYAIGMSRRDPKPIEKQEAATRRQRIGRTARSLGFRGRVEYRHVYSQTGGAQFCLGPNADADLLVVYAEAFERDRDPEDFSLEAILAHECGHQRLLRDRALLSIGYRLAGGTYEEVLASLLGSLLVGESRDAAHLVWKATVDLATVGMRPEQVARTIEGLRSLLREFV